MNRKTPAQSALININCIDITLPFSFLSSIHEQLAEGPIRDAIGHLFFGEELSQDVKSALHYEGINPNLIVVHNTRNKL